MSAAVGHLTNYNSLMERDPMKTSTDAWPDSSATRSREVWRGLWLSWWDGVWLWIGFLIAVAIAMLPISLLNRVSPSWVVTRVVGGVLFFLFVLVSPVVMSRVFRALDNTRPWERNRS